MKGRIRFVFSGAGGQGVVTAAIVLAEAAVLYENLVAVQSQTYGPEARGGAARSDVIISDSEIYFPKVTQPNVLVCLTQEAYNKYHSIIRPGGLLISDSRYVKTEKKIDARQVALPMFRTVMEKIGNSVVFNMCLLGAVVALTDILKPESIVKAMERRLEHKFPEVNRRALDLGLRLGKESMN
jgi:2-oxoglutarate ferredoxin oxidoreductase subunit gamma